MGEGNENNQGFGYDYHSVMHYPDWGFSSNGKPTITTKDPAMQKVIGQRQGFSKQDIQEVNRLYKCRGKTSGIGGKNGCLDKDLKWCASVLAKGDYQCKFDTVRDYCKKSCKRC